MKKILMYVLVLGLLSSVNVTICKASDDAPVEEEIDDIDYESDEYNPEDELIYEEIEEVKKQEEKNHIETKKEEAKKEEVKKNETKKKEAKKEEIKKEEKKEVKSPKSEAKKETTASVDSVKQAAKQIPVTPSVAIKDAKPVEKKAQESAVVTQVGAKPLASLQDKPTDGIEIYAPLKNSTDGKFVHLPDLFYIDATVSGQRKKQFSFITGLKKLQQQLDSIMNNLRNRIKALPQTGSDEKALKKQYEDALKFIADVRTDRKLIKITMEYLLWPSKYTFKAGVMKPDNTFVTPQKVDMENRKEIVKLTRKLVETKKEILDLIDKVTEMITLLKSDPKEILEDFKKQTD